MERSKTWFKDLYKSDKINFVIGDKVVLFRRKGNGYPRALEENVIYRILRFENENLIVTKEESYEAFNQSSFITTSKHREIKVHRSYVIPMNINRINLIDKLLMED
jgi:hypothetical protein